PCVCGGAREGRAAELLHAAIVGGSGSPVAGEPRKAHVPFDRRENEMMFEAGSDLANLRELNPAQAAKEVERRLTLARTPLGWGGGNDPGLSGHAGQFLAEKLTDQDLARFVVEVGRLLNSGAPQTRALDD